MSKASERLDLTDERIDRVAKAVGANAAEFDKRLGAEQDERIAGDGYQQSFAAGAHHRLDGLAARLGKLEMQPSGLGELGALKDYTERFAKSATAYFGSIERNHNGLCGFIDEKLADINTDLDNIDAALEADASEIGDLRAEFKACTENADAGNTNDEHVFQTLAEVEQLASLTAQRVLKAEAEIKAAHARASAANSRWLGLNTRLYLLESLKNRGFRDRLWWLFFGE